MLRTEKWSIILTPTCSQSSQEERQTGGGSQSLETVTQKDFPSLNPWCSTFHQVLLYYNLTFIKFITDTTLLSNLKAWSCVSHIILQWICPEYNLCLSFILLLHRAAGHHLPSWVIHHIPFKLLPLLLNHQSIRLYFLQSYIPKAIPWRRSLPWAWSYHSRGSSRPTEAHSSLPSSFPPNLQNPTQEWEPRLISKCAPLMSTLTLPALVGLLKFCLLLFWQRWPNLIVLSLTAPIALVQIPQIIQGPG